jgi:CheY-like chemotaxis protein
MKLDYKILWVDDRIEERPFQKILNSTKEHLLSENFECEIYSAKDYLGFIENYKIKNEYDLIITDFTLNNGTFGNQVIDYVRDNQHNYTEIFFYSAQTNINDIKLFSSSRITVFQLTEGDYKELENEVIEVINQTIKKFQHIVAMRGMIMNETSTIDAEMLEIVTKFIQETNRPEVKNRIFDELISFHSRKLEDSQKFKRNDHINGVLKDPLLISSIQRANAIEEIIKIMGIENFIEDLKLNIIKVRNDFAHAVYMKDKESGREYFLGKNEGIDFNEEKCKEIRINIIKHKKNINNLKNKLA